VFLDPGVLTAGIKIPERSGVQRRNGPIGKRPDYFFILKILNGDL
jgi:hypothetical protein